MSTTTSLQTAFAFTADDLATNKQGQLAASQITVMEKFRRNATVAVVTLLSVLVAIALVVLITGITLNNTATLGFGLFLIIVLPLVGYWWSRGERDKWAIDLRNNMADSVYGTIYLTTSVNTSYRGIVKFTQYRLRIENLEFAISEDQHNALTEGGTYCIYYAPRSEMVLSIEVPE